MARKRERKQTKKKDKKIVSHGIMYIHSTFNNTVITIADKVGNVLTWCSGGVVGFKGSRKSTPFAAQLAAEKVLKDAEVYGLQTLDIRVKGPGAGRESAIRSVGSTRFKVKSIKDVTPFSLSTSKIPSIIYY